MRLKLSVLLAFFAASCDSDIAGLYERVETDSWRQTPTDKVDILWVIDDSNSMRAEQESLAEGFESFSAELEATGVDFHIGVITTTFLYDDPNRGVLIATKGGERFLTNQTKDYVSEFQTLVQVGIEGDGKEKGLEAAAHALSPSMAAGSNQGFLREEANLLVVFVSDEDDCSDYGALTDLKNTACYTDREALVPVVDFVDQFNALKTSADRVLLGAIVGPENTSSCADAYTGTRYIEAAAISGGISASICEDDWSSVLYDLGLNATGIFTTFQLSHGAQTGTLVVTIDGAVVPEVTNEGEAGFLYNDDTQTITFYDPWVPPRDAEIIATYTIKPGT